MTKLSDRLEALAEKAFPPDCGPAMQLHGVFLNRALLAETVKDNLPTILQALKDKEL